MRDRGTAARRVRRRALVGSPINEKDPPEEGRKMTNSAPQVGQTSGIRVLLGSVGFGYLFAATFFAVAGVFLTIDPANGGTALAAAGSLALTLPVLFARIAPARAAGAQAAGLLVNELVFGPMVRCGFVVPAMVVIVFALGAAGGGRHRIERWLGLLLCLTTTALLLAWDPALDNSAALFLLSLVAGVWVAGVLIRSRTMLITSLRRHTQELADQRDRTAELEVAADRARVGLDLERLIRTQISEIAMSAQHASTVAATDPDGARAALADVESSGRATLAQMRDVVGDLREVSTEPFPGLDQLSDLLRRATSSETTLEVCGTSRPLSATLELSAYRIVEQLLTTLRSHPEAQVEVTVRFTDEALEISACGPAAEAGAGADFRARAGADAWPDAGTGPPGPDQAMNAVRARAELHGGMVQTHSPSGRRETEVRLPLVSTAPR
jgi:signal transduction histidine kinase